MSKHFMLLRKVGKEQDLFQTSDRLPALRDAIDNAQTVPEEKTARQIPYHELPLQEVSQPEFLLRQIPRPKTEPPNRIPQIRWRDAIKKKIRGAPRGSTRSADNRSDLETLRYREQLKLVLRIFPVNAQSTPQLVLFSSLESEAAACSITARTAEILAARAEGPVCVVDANFQSPLVHRYFGIENRRGFSESLSGPGPVQEFAVHLSNSDLWVMPIGSSFAQIGVPEISKRVSSRMMELRTLFKYIVVSCPLFLERLPALQSFAADGTVLIVEANTTRRQTVREVMDELQIAGARMLGVVLNNRTFPIPDAIYHKF
jgi:Mrp family chromosome partitioning ATPase